MLTATIKKYLTFHLHKSLCLSKEVAEEESVMQAISQVPVVGFDWSNKVARYESCSLKRRKKDYKLGFIIHFDF